MSINEKVNALDNESLKEVVGGVYIASCRKTVSDQDLFAESRIITKASDVVTKASDVVTKGSDVVTKASDIITKASDIITSNGQGYISLGSNEHSKSNLKE